MRYVDLRSLRFRLLVWLGGVALVVVGLTWLLHGILLNDLARSFLGERLKQEAEYTLLQLAQGHLSPHLWQEAKVPVLQVFHHLYVLELDDEITTSHPHWLTKLAPLLEGQEDALVDVAWSDRHLLVYRKTFEMDDRPGVLLIGEDFGKVEAGLEALHWWVGGVASLLLVLLITLNLIAVKSALRPLYRLRKQLEELRSGARERLEIEIPSELDGLVQQLNQVMDEHARRLQRSRESLANLSHALKTPLAATIQVLRGSRPIDPERRQKMLRRLENMNTQLEGELKRSRIAGPSAGQRAFFRRDVEQLIEMFATLYPHCDFCFEIAASVPATTNIERQDFTEMLGIVLDNAGKWASREIRCRILHGDYLSILIEDDGPGVTKSELDRLGQRGLRLDEARPGHGLGLSILRQLVGQYSGQVSFQNSSLGGLLVEITLPVS